MEIFIGRLRKVLNHLTREGHVDFHKKIAEAAERRFKSVDDCLIQDWIDTENSYIKFSIGSPEPEDARCDADRTLLEADLKDCNEILEELYSCLVSYLGKARIKTSRRFMESKEILAHIDRLIASI